jgi:sucrose-6-phosphate hydrolase SacC (GH32 family)
MQDEQLMHYIHPEHAVGDVHPFYHDGSLYLYYLKPGGKYEAALLRSTDLLNWEAVEISHEPDGLSPPLRPYFVLGIFYDPASKLFRSYFGSDGNIMRGSTSEDLLTWRAAGEAYNIPAQPDYTVQRDPFVFWNEEEQQYWVVMTCRKGGSNNGPHGGIAYAASPDLTNWTPCGDLYFHGNMGDPECPEMFQLGDKWYLLFSAYDHKVGRPNYLMSDHSTGPWDTDQAACLDGSDLAAAQTVSYGTGRLLFGWIPLQDTETLGHQYWGGHLAFPREIYREADGTLGSRLEASIGRRIRGDLLLSLSSNVLNPASPRLELAGLFDRIDMDLEVQMNDSNGYLTILLQHAQAALPPVSITLDQAEHRLLIATEETIHSDLPIHRRGPCTRMRIVVEADIVEVFMDDRYSLAARTSARLKQFTVSISSRAGNASLQNIQVYQLQAKGG